MNKEEIIVLINATAISLNTIIGNVEFAWDGGQKGSYYICEPSRFTEESIEDINYCLDGLSSAVSKFLQENDLQEEDLWN